MTQSFVFLSAQRTPFGAHGGALRDVSATELGISCSRAALERAGVRPDQIDHVVFGSVLQSSPDSIYTARHIGLGVGVPERIPALIVNRLCGSSFEAIVQAYMQFQTADAEVALVGGTESMSLAPYVLRSARFGMRMGNQVVGDMMTEALYDPVAQAPMAITAENLAEQYKISRAEADAFALLSQTRFQDALIANRFKEEISPIEVIDRKGKKTILEKDEHPRPETTVETLAKLKPIFKKDGVVTAGNASGIVDGACALVVATESRAQREGWKPIARLVSYGIAGCDPKVMGIGPVPAAQIALKRASMKLEQMDLIEVNEAFAPQALSVQKELHVDPARFNVDGGAIAVGHPLGSSGARLTAHIIFELKRRGKKYGLASACIGGGQGIALIVEVLS